MRTKSLSGRFLLRLPAPLHSQLRQLADERGISLNSLCIERLGNAGDSSGDVSGACSEPALAIVTECSKAWGDRLEGLVLFGSVARGEATTASDADLLIVLAQGEPIERSVYRSWDGLAVANARLDGHIVTPQFVALPETAELAGGLWYEVALDGRLLWDRRGAVARILVQLRRAMANGAIARHETHGHPYWVRRNNHA